MVWGGGGAHTGEMRPSGASFTGVRYERHL